MAKVFSWKVAPGKYAYLEPLNGSYIRSRVTDPTAIRQMANTINSWSENEYKYAFNAMKAEVNRVYGTISGDYSDYYSIGDINGGTVVLLAGKDGVEATTEISEQYLNERDYTELLAKIEEELEKYKADIMSQVESVRNSIENAATADISEAINGLIETRGELNELRDRLTAAATKAQNAIDAVRGLSVFADGEVDPQILEDILMLEGRFNAWTSEYEGKISSLLVDYDSVTQQLGSIAVAISTHEGQLSMMLENINTVSGTVGTVKQTWAANSGIMETISTWYNESAATYAEVTRLIDASRAAIEDVVEFYNGETTSRLKEYFDGALSEIGRKIETISDSISGNSHATVRIEERLNGLSGIVSTSISRYDGLSGRVCDINTEMDAMAGSLSTAITVANNALQEARNMRDVWTQESGMLRSVTDLIIEVDENGDPIYYYVDPNLPDHGDESQWVRVYYIGDDPVTGLPIYNTKKDGTGTEYRDHVVPSYKAKMMSYILQNSNAIDLSVMSGDVISALRLAVTEDGSIIYMTADRVIIDSDVLVESLTTKAANVGGVHIGAGMISAQTGDNKWALGSDGVLEATGAKISGEIHATSLTLGSGKSFDQELNDRLSNVSGLDETVVNNLISGYLSTQDFLREDALNGYVDGETLRRWLSEQSGITSAYINTIINAMSGSQINTVDAYPNGSGGVRHVITIGGIPYEWDTWDAGDFVLLNTEYSGMTDSGMAKFLVSKNGLLQANNAIIYGKIYASEGWFKGSVSATNGEFRGDVYANNGYFKGAISATTGYFSKGIRVGADGPTFDEYLDGVVASAMTSGMSPEMVNSLITDYLRESGITMDGYLSQEYFDEWVLNWNASHSANPLTEEEVEQLARAVVGSEITQVFGVSANTDGSLRHSVKIGDRTYYWDTFRTEDYMLLGDWTGDSAHTGTGFCVSTDGLLEANNAVIYGKVFASESYLKGRIEAEEGYFRGSVSATDGYFKGSVSADNGYFHGDVVARSLTLGDSYGGEDISDYISGRLASVSGMDATAVNSLITGYVSSQNFLTGDALNGYVTAESLAEWLAAQSGITSAYINTVINAMSGAQINSAWTESNGSGGTRHIVRIGDQDYSWDTWDAGDFILLNTEYSGVTDSGTAKFLVSKNGLLIANNAVVHGQIYATNGWFKGSISATNGEFRGDVYANNGEFNGAITATSLTLGNNGNKSIEDYVSGRIADGLASGMDSTMVNQLITDYVNVSGASMGFITNGYFENWVDQWNAEHPDNKIDANAASAIAQSIFNSEISKVFSQTTSGGVTTHTATIGDRTYEWKTVDTGDYVLVDTGIGSLSSAGTGGFIISKDGLIEAYNALIYGKIYASEGYFKGSVSADNGYFSGKIVAKEGQIGNISITDNGLSGNNITITNEYMFGDNVAFKGSISATNGYFSGSVCANDGIFRGDVYANNGEFNGAITATSLFLADGAQVDVTPEAIGINTSQFIKINSAITGVDGEVLISNRGLLSAKNAIISGSVYATNGYFKGDIHADSGEFRGEIIASAGTIGGISITEEGLSGKNINITNNYFFSDNVAIKGSISAINGYFSGDVVARSLKLQGVGQSDFNNLVYENTSGLSGSVKNLRDSLNSLSGKVDSWGITDMGDYVQLDHTVASGDTSIKISKEGLLMAKNAIISGSVHATDGVFNGTVYADKGSFKGSVTATSGEFKGSVSADNGYFKGTLCAATGSFAGELKAASGSFNGEVTATSLHLGGTDYTSMPQTFSSGDVIDIISKEAISHAWISTGDGYYKINSPVGGNFIVSNDGLLTANNAILSGSVYATNGVFSGTVYATDGKFKGDISADSGYFRGSVSATNGYFYGEIIASAGTIGGIKIDKNGLSGKNVNITNNYFFSDNADLKGSISADSGYFRGSISAENGYFRGTLCAATGSFKGNLTAAGGTFNGTLNAAGGSFKGSVSAESGYFNGTLCAATGTFKGNLKAAGGTFAGDLSAAGGSFKGSVSADNGYFKGTLCAATGTFGGKLTAAEGSFKGAVSATTLYLNGSKVNGIPNADDFLQLGEEYNNIRISTDGLLVAKNAYVSGTVCATNGMFKGSVSANSLWLASDASVSGKVYATTGKFENGEFKAIKADGFSAENAYIKGKIEAKEGSFKGSLSADSGYFSGTLCAATGTFGGKLTAAEGSFKGAVSATSLYLNGSKVNEIPNSDGFLQLGKEYDNMTVSTDGILLAQNAVVSGSIYATDGIFAGTVRAADVILDGKSLRFSSGSSNGLIISGGTIPIDYIPMTVKVPETAVTATTANTSTISGNFGAPVSFTPQGSGTADMNIPSYKITLSNTSTWDASTVRLRAITQVSTGSTVVYTFSGETYAYLGAHTSININASSPYRTITVTAGKTYRLQRFYEADLPSTTPNPTIDITAEETSFLVPAAAPPSEKCVKIGSNGIQVSLGGGFYFTAADTPDGPIIAMAGRDTNGNMKTIKIDGNGLQVDR